MNHRKSRSGKKSTGFSKRSSPSPRHKFDTVLFGKHTIFQALKNQQRQFHQLFLTRNLRDELATEIEARNLTPQVLNREDLNALFDQPVVHQGIVADVAPLPMMDLDELDGQTPVLLLDQVTDPHNVGAILRSASVFGAGALVMTRRNSPQLGGVLAKSASGALEHVPVILVPNLGRALDQLGHMGYWRIGLDGAGEQKIEDSVSVSKLAIVLGAEGKGLRRLTREHCDCLCAISTSGNLSSLNVSNAAAVALHVIQQSADVSQ